MINIKNSISQVMARIKLKHKLRILAGELKRKGVTVICVDLPQKARIGNLSDFEYDRVNHWVFDFNEIHKEKERICQLYPGKPLEYIESLFQGVVVYYNGRRKALKDYYSKNVNIIGGMRRTTDQPSRFSHTVYTIGACTMRGTGVEDCQTVASILQREINQNFVENY